MGFLFEENYLPEIFLDVEKRIVYGEKVLQENNFQNFDTENSPKVQTKNKIGNGKYSRVFLQGSLSHYSSFVNIVELPK